MRLTMALGIASAATAFGRPVSERDGGNGTAPSSTTKLLIGAPAQILIAEFHGSNFKFTANDTTAGTGPSWMTFKEPNHIYAVDENSENLRHFTYRSGSNELVLEDTAAAAPGLVHLAFNWDQTRLIGSSYGSGHVDIFDVSDGTLKFLKNVTWDEPHGPHELQTTSRAHQAALEQTGQYFAVNDIGADKIMILNSWDDDYSIVSSASAPHPGCGPRHGIFVPVADGKRAALYVVVCEYQNTVEVFDVTYGTDKLELVAAQTLSTFGGGAAGPLRANGSTPFAGAIEMSRDGRNIYVSNRLTGGSSDSIAHFSVVEKDTGCSTPSLRLELVGGIDSFGIRPRMFSLSRDEKYLFSTNQDTGSGLVALSRAIGGGAAGQARDGELVLPVAGAVGVDVFGEMGFGPQFVLQIA